MFIYDLGPGRSSCPYHYEYEEEWLLVLEGAIVVRVPDGEQMLERGDLVCFPPGPAGAPLRFISLCAPSGPGGNRTSVPRSRVCSPSGARTTIVPSTTRSHSSSYS